MSSSKQTTKQQTTTAPAATFAQTAAGHYIPAHRRTTAPTHAVLVTVTEAYRASIAASSSPDVATRYLDERVARWSAAEEKAEAYARTLVKSGERARVVATETFTGREATDMIELAATQFDSLEADRIAQVEATTARRAAGTPRPTIDPAVEAANIARALQAAQRVIALREQLAQATAERNAMVAEILAAKGASGVKISKAVGVDYASVYAWKDAALRAAAKAAPAPAPAPVPAVAVAAG